VRGLGISAGLDAAFARDLAARCEHLGFHSLWSNDEPAASGLETLSHLAAGAPRTDLGVGVLPLDRHEPARIANEIDRLGLDPAKLWIGIGSGQLRPQIDVLQRAVAAMNVALGSVGVAAATRPEIQEALAAYQAALDLPIVRVLADTDAASLAAVADAAAP
jgi:hypothetical protein